MSMYSHTVYWLLYNILSQESPAAAPSCVREGGVCLFRGGLVGAAVKLLCCPGARCVFWGRSFTCVIDRYAGIQIVTWEHLTISWLGGGWEFGGISFVKLLSSILFWPYMADFVSQFVRAFLFSKTNIVFRELRSCMKITKWDVARGKLAQVMKTTQKLKMTSKVEDDLKNEDDLEN